MTRRSALSAKPTWRPQSGRVGTGRRPPEAARRRPPGTEHGPGREWIHRRGRIGNRSRPAPFGFATGRYPEATVLS
jgi:hypothetical protein